MTETLSIDRLGEALECSPGEVVSLVGGGGKTTALFALGRQLDGRVILSTTTKMGSDRTGGMTPAVGPTMPELVAALERDRVVLTWKGIDDHRALGFSAEECGAFSEVADFVVLEADGSRRKPFKAPAAHEPVVPRATTLLVACVGAAAFGAPIRQACHRPELVAQLAGCAADDQLTPRRLAQVLVSDNGSRKHCPPAARFVVLLNQVSEVHEEFVAELSLALGEDVPVVAVAAFVPEDSPEA
jgi:probable selenium-dependent hydroxylase accessory protein YqeC